METAFYHVLFRVFAFVMGAVVGSFLNVCIYRMPLGLSVNEPKRSFCPSCKKPIPWFQNLPLISWLALRGRCASCGVAISPRYLGVELLTALLFLAVYERVATPDGWILILPYWILMALLIVATFIDFEHFIIPDEITWGGVVAGVALSLAIPTMMNERSHLWGGFWSVVGAAVGYCTLWAVVELGKVAFGKKQLKFADGETFTWHREGDDADITVGTDEPMRWSELFAREKDQLIMTCTWVELDGKRFENAELRFHFDRVQIGAETFALEKLDAIKGRVTQITIPREAMGFGDVKFIAAIGAFLGWKAVFFTVFSASVLGAVIGMTTILLGKRAWSAKIPFGPYLALGAVIWMLKGPEIVGWYLSYAAPPL